MVSTTVSRALVAGIVGANWATAARATVADDFDWTAVKPTPELVFHPCYGDFQCGRMQVPMDWHDSDNNKTVAIAVIKLPASVGIDHPAYGGPVLTNPGGPGGSGVGFLRSYGHHLQKVLNGNKFYDIVSFDPRGIRFTTPNADCFNDVFARDTWKLESRGLGLLDGGIDPLRRHLALFGAFGALCENTLADSEILKHASTAVVSRDMVEMVDRLDEYRRKQVKAASPKEEHGMQRPIALDDAAVPRLQYIGFSYGTILGNTFASMFPERVGRVVVDGVADSNDYVKGGWLTNLMDTEAIVDLFYSTCYEEGDGCPLRQDTDTSGKDIRTRVDNFIADTNEKPISFVQNHNVRAITGKDFLLPMIPALYKPIAGFPRLAQVLADALTGNYTLLDSSLDLPVLQDACTVNSTTPMEDDAQAAILCSDGEDNSAYQAEDFTKYIAELKKQSVTLGPYWALIRTQCSGRKWEAKWRFTGPFTTPPAEPGKEGVPAAPLLFLTSRLDPVTPLANAFAMSKGHPGSAVVIQESVGHCAIPTGWSDCMNEILRDYFEHGVVPETGTVCDTACRPWQKQPCGLPGAMGLGLEELRMPTQYFPPSL